MVRLIITADDFGRADGINKGIVEAYRHGIVTQASVLIKAPKAQEAIEFAKDNPGLGVGLHLDLDRFCIIRRPEGIVEGFKQNPVPLNEILEEARAQIAAFKDSGSGLYHLDSHHHIHLRPEIFLAITELLKEYNIKTTRFSDEYYKQYFGGQYIKEFRAALKKHNIITTDYFIGGGWDDACFDIPSSASAELMVHPGYPGDGVSLPEWRMKELKFCLNPRAKEEFKKRDIKLITFKELCAG